MNDYPDPASTGGQLLVDSLISEGVTEVFGLPGIQLDPAIDALHHASENVHLTAVRHEQSATYMADGYARVTGRPGVAMVVPGPGMLNATAGLATAYACSSPVLLIAGQVPSSLIGKGHGALHEIPDQTGILRSLTKWTGSATSPDEIPKLVHEAFFQMRSGRPRPVALEIPVDVLGALGRADIGESSEPRSTVPSLASVQDALLAIGRAQFPVIFAGAGAIDAGSELVALAEALHAPIVTTRESRGVADARHPLVLDRLAFRRLREQTDLVIAVGTRLRSAKADPVDIGGAELLSINIDPDDGLSRNARVRMVSDAALGVDALVRALPSTVKSAWGETIAEIHRWSTEQLHSIGPQVDYLAAIRRTLPDDGILVTEYTQVGYVASAAFPVHSPRSYVSPGYQGTLGYGFATSLGAQIGAPGRRVVSLNGDGGFSWTMSELSTMRKYNVNCIVIVFNDGHYGNVRRIQGEAYGGRYLGTDLVNPDYVTLATAFGIAAHRVASPQELERVLDQEIRAPRPVLIEAIVGEFPSPWSLID